MSTEQIPTLTEVMERPRPRRWEYLVLSKWLAGKIQAKCNELGAKGWELVSIVPGEALKAPFASAFTVTNYIMTFKRPC